MKGTLIYKFEMNEKTYYDLLDKMNKDKESGLYLGELDLATYIWGWVKDLKYTGLTRTKHELLNAFTDRELIFLSSLVDFKNEYIDEKIDLYIKLI